MADKKIGSIVFGFMSPKDIKKMATVKIVTADLYDKEGYPVDGGLIDTRLGVIDPGLKCKTCSKRIKDCTGHFGFIELARPVIHAKYVKPIHDVLRSTCRMCSRVLLSEEALENYVSKIERIEKEGTAEEMRRFTNSIIIELRKAKKCLYCNEKQIEIKLEKPMTYIESGKKISPIEIISRLEKVPEKDLIVLGMRAEYARPDWMILTVLPVPPVTMRPSITLDTGERSEDDLTHKLGDVIRINQRLFENINAGAPEVIIEDLWELLQYHITTYIDNEISDVPPARHRSGQPLKTLVSRIKSKDGRFRHNLAGKRVNYSARTVISPDPDIEFNEVGIPQVVAREVTIPETITEFNIEKLKELVKRGAKNYPGANYVLRPDGKRKKITDETVAQLLEELQPGFVVERHIIDGDIAIFNRQPSLHRMSIMCHKIRVLPGRSFRLHPAVCNPYNADFDGDEMNLHFPQNEEARAEAEILMQVQTQLITPKNGSNVIGCVEDSISGNYILTKYTKMSSDEAISMLVSIGIENQDLFSKFKKEVTGKEIFSTIIPKDFNFRSLSKKCDKCKIGSKKLCPTDHCIFIQNGELLSGSIGKDMIGEEKGRLIREIQTKYGNDKTVEIMGKIFKLGVKTLLKYGFTIGVNDTEISEEEDEKVSKKIKESEKEVEKLIEVYRAGKLYAYPGKTIEETLEIDISKILNDVRNEIGKLISSSVSKKNPIIIMNKAGKGSKLHLAMMAACVGQQSLMGQRIPNGYKDRTLTLFKKGDLGPRSRGFIKSSYRKGLDPVEFFFAAMTGRNSLMDTALRTPKSGYLYRRLANAMQDLRVEYDSTIRDANKTIIQFKYGDDGIDVSKSENGIIDVKKIIEEVIGE